MGGTIALLDFALAGLGIWLAKRLLAKRPAAPLPVRCLIRYMPIVPLFLLNVTMSFHSPDRSLSQS